MMSWAATAGGTHRRRGAEGDPTLGARRFAPQPVGLGITSKLVLRSTRVEVGPGVAGLLSSG